MQKKPVFPSIKDVSTGPEQAYSSRRWPWSLFDNRLPAMSKARTHPGTISMPVGHRPSGDAYDSESSSVMLDGWVSDAADVGGMPCVVGISPLVLPFFEVCPVNKFAVVAVAALLVVACGKKEEAPAAAVEAAPVVEVAPVAEAPVAEVAAEAAPAVEAAAEAAPVEGEAAPAQ